MTIVQPAPTELKIAKRAPQGIVLAESAARRLARLAEVEGHPVLLRVAVDGGGCSGFQYRMDLVETGEADDLRIETDGQAALVDPISVPFLKGSEIAWVDELAGAQFVIRNPNAATSCGCGVSFSI
ncbi:MAG: iron-sulfur cluster assembly accessory protein [Brevundimonas subvibrioides]|jgi:iron-sulfur cluster assembly accessory protein|uniref:Iron-sulfur cluster assembly accessory protein n=1 Tax=Brevundimonas subvibrioides TaxID=74313 RepID=A0A258HQ64_9CAUL|nr:iron-sulfur cluster insertion protein ErpA [Brevundimonas subvibrioides]OYX58929.1 MAG: iron-sulfur cluster assembly accessory protein [Brevundimonas subvibrioides]